MNAWAEVVFDGHVVTGAGVSIRHVGVGVYNVTVTAASCRDAGNNAPVVSVSDSEPPGGQAPTSFPVAWTMPASTGIEAFTIYTGVVVNGEFQPKDPMPILDQVVGTVLSQHTSDVNSDRAFARLKARFPAWEQAAHAPVEEIEDAIRCGGLARQKARRIKQGPQCHRRTRGSR